MKKVLVIDNYDSFTYNLVHALEEILGHEVTVKKNDQLSIADVDNYEYLILSPGPGLPEDAGLLKEIIKTYMGQKKIFGVCLGLQAIAEVYGCSLKNLEQVYHGIQSEITLTDKESPIYRDLNKSITAGRYHSWVIDEDTLVPELKITSREAKGQIMSIEDRNQHIYAVQTRSEAREVLINISEEKYNPSQVAAFISVYLMRSIAIEELTGFREALLELCVPIDLEGQETIDVCGTGGDGKNTFNISTTSAFVIAGAGYKVSKHGNYGVSSICGSSNVLQHLGYNFTRDESLLKRQLDRANICFFHAPLFHPALKSVGPIRKNLGVKTFFNYLGPLVNPARPTHQLIGVFNLKVLKLYQFILENTTTRYSLIHSIDGYDEVSLTGEVKIIQNNRTIVQMPEYFGTKTYAPEDIYGGADIPAAAKIFMTILEGKGSPAQNDVVSVNAGIAINTFKPEVDLADCIKEARTSIANGAALSSFKKLIETT